MGYALNDFGVPSDLNDEELDALEKGALDFQDEEDSQSLSQNRIKKEQLEAIKLLDEMGTGFDALDGDSDSQDGFDMDAAHIDSANAGSMNASTEENGIVIDDETAGNSSPAAPPPSE